MDPAYIKGKAPRTLSKNIGDTDLSYLYYEGDGPVIVMLHATGFLPWLWHPIARELTPEYQVIAPYFCDHRVVDPAHGGLNWMTIAEDLSRFCSAISIEHPFLVGHSMGATVVTMAVAVFGLQAIAMVLIEPIFLPENFYGVTIRVDEHPLASRAIKRTNYWSDPEEALNYLKSRSLFESWDPEMLDLYLRFGMQAGEGGGLQLVCSPEREAALFMGGLHQNPWPLLSNVTCPCLVLEGETSENRSFIDLPKAVSLFPRGSYRMIPGTGHLIPMEHPKEMRQIIRDFFDLARKE
jgi:pimeloyl-ACP methyl ester carboxylesterase